MERNLLVRKPEVTFKCFSECQVTSVTLLTLGKAIMIFNSQSNQNNDSRFRRCAQLLRTTTASRWGHQAWHWAAALGTHGAVEWSQRLESRVGWRANPTPSSQSTRQRRNYNHITQHCSLTALWRPAAFQGLTTYCIWLWGTLSRPRVALSLHEDNFAVTPVLTWWSWC